MATSPGIQIHLPFQQLVEVLKALPKKEKKQLLDVLQENDAPATIPDWQKKEVHRRLKDLQKNPAKAVSWTQGMKRLKQAAK
jgi:putative addiction module component (TIGR02574 family)